MGEFDFSETLGIVSMGDVSNVSYVFPFATSILNDQPFKLAEGYYNSTE